MDIKLIASDLDGTIIDKDNNVCEDNFRAIKEISNKNIYFVISTGKSFSVSKNICGQFNASYGIFGNGTQIVDLKNEKELLRNVISKQDLLYAVTIAKRLNLHIHIYTESEIISEELMYMDLRNFIIKSGSTEELKFKLVDDIQDYINNNSIDVFSAIFSSENDLKEFENIMTVNKEISSTLISKRGRYKDYIINKEYEYVNISPKDIDKDIALNFLSDYLNIGKENMMTIGDNVNDLQMIKNAGVGVAVADAYDELKSVANYITTKTAKDGGFAEAIFKHIL